MIDILAYFGDHTRSCRYLEMVKVGSQYQLSVVDGAHVVAFEPQPSNLFYLKSSLAASYLSNDIELHEAGLSNVSANHTLFYQTQNHGNSVMGVRVSDSGILWMILL